MSSPTSHSRVPLKAKAGWSFGAFTDVMMTNVFSYLALPIYNIGLHVDPRFLGWSMGLPRVWEALSDPLIGNISDNTRSRWGRRKPYVLVGALLCGLFFALAWCPPAGLSAKSAGVYFFVVAMFFYTAYAVFSIPWGALGLELSSDYHERTNIQAWRSVVQALGGLFLGALWWLSFHLGGGDEVAGVRWVGIIFGSLIAVAGVVAALSSRENLDVQTQEKIPLISAFRDTFRNRQFLLLCGIVLLVFLGIFLIQPFTLYINIHYVFGGAKEPVAALNMVMNFIFQGVGLALTPLVAVISRRTGKKPTLVGGLVFVLIGYLLSWVTYTPTMPYLQMVTLALCSVGLSCLWVITPSMLADLCDIDEHETGLRREGMYNAAFAWVTKAGVSATLILSGYMLQWSGFRAEAETQTQSVVFMLRLLFVLVPTIFIGGAIILALCYSVSEGRILKVREELDRRKSFPNLR